MKNYDDFTTNDLALAATLSTLGFSIEAIEKQQFSSRATFVFIKNDNLSKVVESYWSDKLRVNPKNYFDALKHIKTRIYARSQ